MELLHIDKQFDKPARGSFLLSEPFLNDLKFRRTVVLLGDHTEEGTVGFILNRLLNITTKQVVPDMLTHDFPVFYGGPVEPNTLHFIHKAGEVITGAQEISPGLFWGGDIDQVNVLMAAHLVTPDMFRFFLGYSGWEPGQLQDEIDQKAWWVIGGDAEVIFDDDLEELWPKLVRKLGKDFAYLAEAPEDPQWN